MASVSAVQVGSFFVQQYYQVLQQQPDFVHHFYTDESTMLRIDGNTSESATTMLVERMISDAEKFAEEDKEKRDAIDTKNQADSVVYQTEKQLKE